MNLKQFQLLGVLNRTPNSFSDAGISLQREHFISQVKNLLSYPHLILDVGFESTAPTNSPITFDEEMIRLDLFLNEIKLYGPIDEIKKRGIISFDTYRPESFFEMIKRSREAFGENFTYIFNDVSGVLDERLRSVFYRLKDNFEKKSIYYIYNFTQIPERGLVLSHPQFVKNNCEIKKEALSAFRRAYDFMDELGLSQQLILDIGLGFSKSYDQNWELINDFPELLAELKSLHIDNPILIGLSKKSFLRQRLSVTDPNLTEGLHGELLKSLKEIKGHHLLFRVHNPSIY